MIQAQLSFLYEFTLVPSCGSVLAHMIPAQNLIHVHVRVHSSNCTRAIFIPVRKLIPMSHIGSMTVHSSVKSISRKSGTGGACIVFNIPSEMTSQSQICLFKHTSAGMKCSFM